MQGDVNYPNANFYPRTDRGGEYYVDFSAWKPVEGARRGPLYIDERRTKTTNKSVAAAAFGRLLATMEARWRRHLGVDDGSASGLEEMGLDPGNPLVGAFALRVHFPEKRGNVEDTSLRREIRALKVFLRETDPNLRIKQLTPPRLEGYLSHRRRSGIAPRTIAIELSAVSELAKTAISKGVLDHNPVRQMRWKPKVSRKEARFLENSEGGDVLVAARRWDAAAKGRATPFMEALLCCHLVQGCRDEEARGTLRRDIELKEGRFHIRPNRYRGLKRDGHKRVMPLWPQTRSAMERHFFVPDPRNPDKLIDRFEEEDPIFPGTRGGIISDVRISFWNILVNAGLATLRDPENTSKGIEERITFHTLRHTYCAARLQTLDRGAPIQQHTVMAEMGHRDYKLIAEIYGHVHLKAPRGEEVLYVPSTETAEARARSEVLGALRAIESDEGDGATDEIQEKLERAFG